MNPQLLTIITPGKMFFIKGKLSRSPLSAIINSKEELNLILSSLHSQDAKYTISDFKDKKKIKTPVVIKRSNVVVKREKIESSKKTILEKISEETEDK